MKLIFYRSTEKCKLFTPEGVMRAEWEMRNRTVESGFGHWGKCPDGVYHLGTPRPEDSPPFGRSFIPVIGVKTRVGIGIHGGGSGLLQPMAPRQGWRRTHGCFRMQNEDLAKLVKMNPTGWVFEVRE